MPTNIVVPELGESIVEARVARWLKQEGDPVALGEALVELETEKVDLEVGASHAGVLSKIERHDGEDVKIGERLGVIDDAAAGEPAARTANAQPAPAPSAPAAPAVSAPAAPASSVAAARAKPQASTTAAPAERPRATPTARRVADDHAIDVAAVPGSGAAGRVTRQDVESFVKGPAGAAKAPPPQKGSAPAEAKAPQPPAPSKPATTRSEERVRMSKRRATIARRLVEAQHAAAMLTTFNEVDMSVVQDLRRHRKEWFKQRFGVTLGITSFFVKAAVSALRAFPRLNAEIQGEEIVLKRYYDIGIAVGAEAGLVVPVLRDADRLSFAEIERGIKEFARKADEGTLTLEDLRGGTFTITNGGVYGSLMSTPILNPPQVGILGLHKIADRVVPVAGQPAIRPMMYLALSYDHRIVDGLEAVQFLVRIKEVVEDPLGLLLEG
jgi:2-oxoglutarate dehydrogenase E2 component (dihydrolipoamide succinyltransferase)